MVVELDVDSSAKSSADTSAERPVDRPQPNVSPAKRRRLENLVQDLAASSATTVKSNEDECDFKPGDVTDFNHDIFDTDGDRQNLIDVCERMLEDW